MPMVEKYGGLWVEVEGKVVYERHDQTQDLLAVVVERFPGIYRACLFEKSSHPQWSLPSWVERRPESLFASQAEAVRYLESTATA